MPCRLVQPVQPIIPFPVLSQTFCSHSVQSLISTLWEGHMLDGTLNINVSKTLMANKGLLWMLEWFAAYKASTFPHEWMCFLLHQDVRPLSSQRFASVVWSQPSATTKKALKVCTGEHARICCRCEVHTWCWQTLVPLPHSHHWLLSLVKRIRKPVQLWTFSATRWQICIFTSWQAFVSAEICRLVPIRTAHDNMLLFSSLSLWFQVQMTPTDQWTNSSAMHRNVLCHATPRKSGGTASPPSYEELLFIGLQGSGDTTLI